MSAPAWKVIAKDSGLAVVAWPMAKSPIWIRHHHRQRGQRARTYHLAEVRSLQPRHLHQPEPDREGGRQGSSRRGHCRWTRHAQWRVGSRPERLGRLYDLARLQLRRRRHHVGEDGEGRYLHLHPHRSLFDLECRETKLGDEEITRDVPNVSEDAKTYLDEGHHHPGRRSQRRRYPRWQSHAERPDRADAGREAS
jgi:hypothetical protein